MYNKVQKERESTMYEQGNLKLFQKSKKKCLSSISLERKL